MLECGKHILNSIKHDVILWLCMGNKIVITCGVSGCGKTTYLRKNYPSYALVCPDDLRKTLTGDISDQSKNDLVWKNIYDLIAKLSKAKKDFAVSATNLTWKGLKQILDNIFISDELECEILLFKDSENWQLCRNRVAEDIKNGVDRSNTVNVKVGDSLLIEVMSEKYLILKNEIVNNHIPLDKFNFPIHFYEIDGDGNKNKI